MNELQASLLEAINTVSRGNDNNNVQTVTIEAEIISVEDLAKGIYKAKYQSSTMTVYSTGTVYNVGQHVYIIVPNGDFSKNKVILGLCGGLAGDTSAEDKVAEGEAEYIEVTQNLLNFINTNGEVSISSYIHGQKVDNMRSADTFKAATKKYKKFKLSCDIRTTLPAEQQKAMGEYGFKIRYKTTQGYYEVKIDTSNILGNPYSLTQWSHQFITFDFPENVELDLSEMPTYYWYTGGNFYKKDEQPKDIFFKNMQLTALMELPVVKGYYLYLVPDNGLTFTNIVNEINITPDLRLDGVSVNLAQKSAQCYWFIQDNSILSADNKGYLPLMGARWRCINQVNDEGVFISDNNYKLNILSQDVFTTEKYSCLIIYDGIAYKQEVNIEQFNSSINFEIKANAESYTAGIGSVTLTATSDYTPDAAENISFSWARYDKNGNYIDSEWWTESNELTSTIVFPTSKIDGKNTFSCSLISNKYNKPLATANYEIVVEESPVVRLVTYNTNVLYKYDANGVSPFHPSYGGSLGKSYATIKPISFKIFKPDGSELTVAEYAECQWSWTVSSNTMLDLDRKWLDENKTFYVITDRDFNYNIRSYYSAARNENTVSLSVIFDGATYSQDFEIQFIKDGDNGTNGTDYVGSIVFDNIDRLIVQGVRGESPYVTMADGSRQREKITLGAIVYHLGQETTPEKVIWEMLEPEKTLFSINKDTGELTLPSDVSTAINAMNDKDINIIKATIKINNTTLYAYRVIEYIFFDEEPNVKNFSIDNGPFEIIYNSDGSRGQIQASDPFVAMHNDKNANRIIDTSVDGNSWTIGSGFSLAADEDSGVSKRYLKTLENLGDKVHTILYVSGNHDRDNWVYYRPILLRKNTYGMADLNSWDGTRLYLDENGNYIYAAQVGAGTKDNYNRFTGVIMGTDNKSNQGLFGYKDGERSFFFDAKTGKAEFGINEKGRIIIDPKNEALIYGGNYKTGTDGSGMLINLTKPSIKFGSGKFEVDENGTLSAIDGKFKGTIEADEGYLKDLNVNGTLKIGNGSGYDAILRKVDNSGYAIFYITKTADGTIPFRINGNGSIVATAGKVGGFDISSSYISSGGTSYASSGLTLSTADFTRSINGTNRSLRFAIGSKFGVASDGTVYASGATFSGTLTAGSGSKIGGWNVDSHGLYYNGTDIGCGLWGTDAHANIAIHAGSTTSAIGSAPFRVYHNGQVVCTNISITGGAINLAGTSGACKINNGILNATGATITGKITADSGYIGDLLIEDGSLKSGTGITIDSSGDVLYLGSDGIKVGTLFSIKKGGGRVAGWEVQTSSDYYGGLNTYAHYFLSSNYPHAKLSLWGEQIGTPSLQTAPKIITLSTWYGRNATRPNQTGATNLQNDVFYLDAVGNLKATSLSQSSSIRYKENIMSITKETNLLNNFSLINTYQFDYKNSGNEGKNKTGMIAEELVKIYPNAVLLNENQEPDAINYIYFIPLLIEKVKELEQQIKEIKGE